MPNILTVILGRGSGRALLHNLCSTKVCSHDVNYRLEPHHLDFCRGAHLRIGFNVVTVTLSDIPVSVVLGC